MNDHTNYAEAAAIAVRAAMTAAGVNPHELSDGADVAYTTLKRKLSGAKPFNVEELGRIAKYLGVDRATLVAPKVAA